MVKVRILLMRQGYTDYDFETDIVKPRIGELITIEGKHYEVKFIQYLFDEDKQFKHLLVTAIKG
jgi:hypothetical protein